jgi:hypothetical protein
MFIFADVVVLDFSLWSTVGIALRALTSHNAYFTMESKCINYPLIYSFFNDVALYLLKKERENTRNQVELRNQIFT